MKFSSALKSFEYMVATAIVALGVLFTATALPIPGNYKVYTVLSGSMEPSIGTGSVVIVKPQGEYRVGDIVTAASGDPKTPVTHRITEIVEENDQTAFITKGDANENSDMDARERESIIGKVLFSIPLVGYPMAWVRTPMGFMFLVVVPGTIIVYRELSKISGEARKKWSGRRKEEN